MTCQPTIEVVRTLVARRHVRPVGALVLPSSQLLLPAGESSGLRIQTSATRRKLDNNGPSLVHDHPN